MIDEQQGTLGGPILRLPAEITAEIFKEAVWVDIVHHEETFYGIRSLVTPLTLGAVCRSWRAFVWDTPSLWTIITLQLTNFLGYKDPRDILDLWLENSRTRPLEVYFYVNTPDRPDSNYAAEDNALLNVASMAIITLQKLMEQSPRWRKINLTIFDIVELVEMLHRVKGRIPLLEMGRLHINVGERSTLDMFQDAPLLKGFDIQGWMSGGPLLPWKQLTCIEVHTIFSEGCVAILSQCTSLVECTFDLALYRGLPIHPTILLPHLRLLRIINTPDSAIGMILQGLQCPELRRLHLSKDYYSWPELPFLQIGDFIARSGCTLEELQLANMVALSHVLLIIDGLPSLQRLALLGVNCYHNRPTDHPDVSFEDALCNHDDTDFVLNTLLTKLDLTTTSSTLLPNLTELRCKIPLPLASSPPLPTTLNLLKVLRQRWNPPEGVSKFRKLIVEETIRLHEINDLDIIDGLRELIREGMEISVSGL